MNKISTILLDCYNGNIPAQFSAMSKEAREEAVRKELLNVMGLEKFEKSTFPIIPPIIGIIISLTNDDTIFPKAPPIITPIAKSITLPFTANSLNSLNI